jgi:polysaccharide export outer membrane protein
MVKAGVNLFCFLLFAHCGGSQGPLPGGQISRAVSVPSAPVAGPAKKSYASKYTVAPGDSLEVYVVGVPELSRDYRVSTAGTIAMPMVTNEISAQNLTLSELSRAISMELHKEEIVSDPQVFVTVKESPSNGVVISGGVRKPAVYQIDGRTSLMSMLSLAEGPADDAGGTAIITRGEKALRDFSETKSDGKQGTGESQQVVTVNIEQLWKGADPAANIDIYPGDRINVSRAGVVYVVGAVNRAGGYVLINNDERLTVLKALALAGDVTRTAKTKHAVILRKDLTAAGGRRQIPINLKKILANQAPDEQLAGSDILFVPDSTKKRALSSALTAATAVAIYRFPY